MVGLHTVVASLLLSGSALALPAKQPVESRTLGFFDDVLLFDAAAVIGAPVKVEVQTYTFWRQFDVGIGALTDLFSAVLDGIELDSIANGMDNFVERAKLFVSIPRSGREVDIKMTGCGDATLEPTSDDVDGISITGLSCTAKGFKPTAPFEATAVLSDRGSTAKVFPSTPDGIGIISDVDDTIKVSQVLEKVELVKNTFLREPEAVTGMPQLYASLAKSLSNPFFTYISGSPFHLFPFLDKFIETNYPDGPKYLRNITLFDIPQLVETLTDKENTMKHKLSSIDRLVTLYPRKTWVMIGDSTEKDPETYAEAYQRHSANVQCIWIRLVDGAENTAERFTKVFEKVPQTKLRLFKDAEIAAMQTLKVAAGGC